MKDISQIITENKKLILKGSKYGLINKYSLKDRDYRGDRFKDNQNQLTEFCDILSLSKPEIISEIHERYLKSGVDLISTYSINSNRLSLTELSLEDITYEINLSSAKLARNKVTKYNTITRNKPRFALGTISNVEENTEFELAQSIYSEQIKALYAGKIDIIFLNDIKNKISLTASLSAYSKLMVRRKKTGNVIIALSNPELNNILLENNFTETYPNIEFTAVGNRYNVSDSEFLNQAKVLSQKFKSVLISFIANETLNIDEFISRITELKSADYVKIIGLENNFLPDAVSKIVKFLE